MPTQWSSCMNFLTLKAGDAIYVPADCPRKYLPIQSFLNPGEENQVSDVSYHR